MPRIYKSKARQELEHQNTSIAVLKETIKWFKTQIEPHDCGWMYTTIEGCKARIRVIQDEKKGKKVKHYSEYL
jgi:hypothetical protein